MMARTIFHPHFYQWWHSLSVCWCVTNSQGYHLSLFSHFNLGGIIAGGWATLWHLLFFGSHTNHLTKPPQSSFIRPSLRQSWRRGRQWSTSGTRSETASPVAGQISQQFCPIGSTPQRQRTHRQLANIFSICNSGAAGKRRAARPGHGPWNIISMLSWPRPCPEHLVALGNSTTFHVRKWLRSDIESIRKLWAYFMMKKWWDPMCASRKYMWDRSV